MKPTESKRLYERACRVRRVTPCEEEGAAWHRTLHQFDAKDVETALDDWWASTAVDGYGELRSKWPPAPAELKILTAVVKAKRDAARRIPQDLLRFGCSVCAHTCVGFYPSSTPTPSGKRCHCGAEMRSLERMAA